MSEKRPPGCKSGSLWEKWDNFSSWWNVLDLQRAQASWIAGACVGVAISISGLHSRTWWSCNVAKKQVWIDWLHYKSFRGILCSSQSEPSATWCDAKHRSSGGIILVAILISSFILTNARFCELKYQFDGSFCFAELTCFIFTLKHSQKVFCFEKVFASKCFPKGNYFLTVTVSVKKMTFTKILVQFWI